MYATLIMQNQLDIWAILPTHLIKKILKAFKKCIRPFSLSRTMKKRICSGLYMQKQILKNIIDWKKDYHIFLYD